MSVIRTVFLGTPEIASFCLGSLIQDAHFNVVGVVSQPDRPSGRKMQLTPSPVKALALQHNIPILTPENINQDVVLQQLANLNAEVAVVVAFGQILSQKFLDLFPRRVVNVHASLLPRWRGAAPIQRAIMAGDKNTGVCLQVMVKKLDAGDLLGSRFIKISEDMNAVELHEQMKPLAADLLTVELMDFIRGNLTPIPQDESQVTYAKKIEKTESLIDWRHSAQDIHNQIRGLALGPGAHTQRDGKVLKLHKTQVIDGKHSSLPGQVIQVDADSFVVACGSQALRVFELQPESRARQAVNEYLRGYPLRTGDQLGS